MASSLLATRLWGSAPLGGGRQWPPQMTGLPQHPPPPPPPLPAPALPWHVLVSLPLLLRIETHPAEERGNKAGQHGSAVGKRFPMARTHWCCLWGDGGSGEGGGSWLNHEWYNQKRYRARKVLVPVQGWQGVAMPMPKEARGSSTHSHLPVPASCQGKVVAQNQPQGPIQPPAPARAQTLQALLCMAKHHLSQAGGSPGGCGTLGRCRLLSQWKQPFVPAQSCPGIATGCWQLPCRQLLGSGPDCPNPCGKKACEHLLTNL